MKGPLKYLGVIPALSVLLVAGAPRQAAAQQAKLYELVENVDPVQIEVTGHRISNWTAQGIANAGSPFCPSALVPTGVTSCAITAFGTDDIDLGKIKTEFIVGNVWANIVTVANLDNSVDGPEVAIYSGQIVGELTILQPNGQPPVQPDLRKKKSLLGPAIPLIYVVNGQFFADTVPTIRTDTPSSLPFGIPTATFGSTFRLPFKVDITGVRSTPELGKTAYYLGDDGSLIRVDSRDESALGFPLLRADVYFPTKKKK